MGAMQLNAYLADRNETQAAFAGRVGTSEANLSRILAGQQRPRAGLMERIRAATGGAVTPNDFFDAPATPAAPGAEAA